MSPLLEPIVHKSAHGDASTVLAQRSERQRRKIVTAVIFLYLLLVTEGILRKWLLPEHSQALYFVRDPFVIGLYLYALANGQWPKKYGFLTAALLFSIGALLIATIQLVLGYGIQVSPALFAGYGWRNYFLYIPLAFVIGTHFRAEDLERFARITFLLSIPIAILVFIQFHSPVDSRINVGSSDNLALQFRGLGLDEMHTRPMGTFTSDVGQGRFTLLGFSFALIFWTAARAKNNIHFLLALAGTISLATCLAFSGSRGAVLNSAILLTVGVFATLFLTQNRQGLKSILPLLGIGALLSVVAVVFFSDGIAAFVNRWTNAYAIESQRFSGGIFGRALYGFIDFARLIFESPLLGYGLGSGGNASTLMGATIRGAAPIELAETDWARHILDLGPVFGVLFIGFRIALTGWFGVRVLRSRSIPAILLFVTVALELLYGQITGNGLVNGFAWMTAGLCLAAASNATRPPESRDELQPVAAVRFPNVLR